MVKKAPVDFQIPEAADKCEFEKMIPIANTDKKAVKEEKEAKNEERGKTDITFTVLGSTHKSHQLVAEGCQTTAYFTKLKAKFPGANTKPCVVAVQDEQAMTFVEECVAPSILPEQPSAKQFVAARYNVYQAEQSIVGLTAQLSALPADKTAEKEDLEAKIAAENEKIKYYKNLKIEGPQAAIAEGAKKNVIKEVAAHPERFPPFTAEVKAERKERAKPGPVAAEERAAASPTKSRLKIAPKVERCPDTTKVKFKVGELDVDLKLDAPTCKQDKLITRGNFPCVTNLADQAENSVIRNCIFGDDNKALLAWFDDKLAKQLVLVTTNVKKGEAAVKEWIKAKREFEEQDRSNKTKSPPSDFEVKEAKKKNLLVSDYFRLHADASSDYTTKVGAYTSLVKERVNIAKFTTPQPEMPEFPVLQEPPALPG